MGVPAFGPQYTENACQPNCNIWQCLYHTNTHGLLFSILQHKCMGQSCNHSMSSGVTSVLKNLFFILDGGSLDLCFKQSLKVLLRHVLLTPKIVKACILLHSIVP